MAIVLNMQQRKLFAAQLAEQEVALARTMPRVCIVGDSPNLSRSVETIYGRGVRPDFQTAMCIGGRFGQIHEATMVANPGLPRWVAQQYEDIGFTVYLGLAPDCDDRVVRKCVEAALIADVLVCMGGDHAFVDVIRLARHSRRNVKVIVMAVRRATAQCLLDSCDQFVDLPVAGRPLAA